MPAQKQEPLERARTVYLPELLDACDIAKIVGVRLGPQSASLSHRISRQTALGVGTGVQQSVH